MNAMPDVSECPDSPRSRSQALRVLITDQEVGAAEILAMVMSLDGHSVAVARNAEEALQLTDHLRPDVSILDIGMPGLDGKKVAQRIRQTNWGASNLIVALTGLGEAVDGLYARGSDFDDQFTKPVAPSQLLCRIAAWRHIQCRSIRR
jgi:DNA-binding response OmpR family regulator